MADSPYDSTDTHAPSSPTDARLVLAAGVLLGVVGLVATAARHPNRVGMDLQVYYVAAALGVETHLTYLRVAVLPRLSSDWSPSSSRWPLSSSDSPRCCCTPSIWSFRPCPTALSVGARSGPTHVRRGRVRGELRADVRRGRHERKVTPLGRTSLRFINI
ncbi:hypothetical protein [Halorussus caseinilyticus]|uniref:Uncharacterized protein n=1 Tax=Halorussus caseinilyticus TaxID=3034025 RepID=A0ABD5WI61_9EURY